MRTPEQRLGDRTGDNLRRLGIYCERIENGVGAGTPDLLTISRGRVVWFEHKVFEWPKRATTRLQYSHPPTPEQENWHLNWYQKGGRSFFLLGTGTGNNARIFALDGEFSRLAVDLNHASVAPLEIVTWRALARLIETGKR